MEPEPFTCQECGSHKEIKVAGMTDVCYSCRSGTMTLEIAAFMTELLAKPSPQQQQQQDDNNKYLMNELDRLSDQELTQIVRQVINETDNDQKIELRRAHLLEQEEAQPSTWYWLSFAEPGSFQNPRGTFLGVAIVEANGFLHAVEKARTLGINPGGEVKGWELAEVPRREHVNRLLSKAEIQKLDIGDAAT